MYPYQNRGKGVMRKGRKQGPPKEMWPYLSSGRFVVQDHEVSEICIAVSNADSCRKIGGNITERRNNVVHNGWTMVGIWGLASH